MRPNYWESRLPTDEWQHKARIAVRLTPAKGEPVNGFVFCAKDEVVHDVLQDERPYLLMQSDPHSTVMINKKTILRLRVLDNESREMEVYTRMSEKGAVRLQFHDEVEETGEVCPRPGQRVSDVLNQDGGFFLFVAADGTVNYINSSFVERILIHK